MSKLFVPEFETIYELGETTIKNKYSHEYQGKKENWGEISLRVSKNVLRCIDAKSDLIQETANIIASRKFIPGGRYLYATGRAYHQVNNCYMLRCEDSREGWAELFEKASLCLMTGGGIGVDWSQLRSEGKPIRKTGGTSTGPLSAMQITNELGRGIMQGGSRRSAIWAGLSWSHADVMKFIHFKDWIPEVRNMKSKDFNFPATMDGTNISVQLDDEFFKAFHNDKHSRHSLAQAVYWEVVRQMCKTGEPGFSIDVGENAGETLRNACTELTSFDDSDVCNIGSINLSQINSLEEMAHVTNIATTFLLAGTLYSDVPYAKVDQVRNKNRRLGLGIMGVHEFLINHGSRYGSMDIIRPYLEVYRHESSKTAGEWANILSISTPIKTRAIAPTGTIGICASTTTGIEPLFCVALKRRYLKGDLWNYQYVIDPTAKKLIDRGIDPDCIEDAYDLSLDIERRIAFQADVQQYVDHGISSTLNLPRWGSPENCEDTITSFGNTLIKYLPRLRGITAYPDGARAGQPLNPVKYSTAIKHIGQHFEESGEVVYEAGDVCSITRGESCGS